MSRPIADSSVRIAWSDDADAIGDLQVRSWREVYADVLPDDLLEAMPAADFAGAWRQAVTRPREARQRVLVGLERATVRGFAATAPAADADTDPGRDGEVVEFVVDSEHRGIGHGSRLLHAVVDTLRSDKFARALWWVDADADALRGFLVAQGWGPDGAHRELDLRADGAVRVKQVRLHTDLSTG